MSLVPRAAVVAGGATAAALWPVWSWYAARLADGADEKWGLLALGAALAVAFTRRREPSRLPLHGALVLLVAYAVLCLVHLPPLVRALPALGALGLFLGAVSSTRRVAAGTVALLLLALPVESTLQFYAGYPLRVIATHLAEAGLRLCGVGVAASGTLLRWRGEAFGVDAPCSGIHMLWTALFLAALIAALRDFDLRRTAAALATAVALVVVGNGIRVSLLFVKEGGLVPLPAWTHDAIGALVFAGLLAALLHVLGRLEKATTEAPPVPVGPLNRTALGLHLGACALAALVPLIVPARAAASETGFPGWPERLDGVALAPLPLDAREERFARGFPGRLGRFTDGRRAVLLRWLTRPTRLLHPAADCFRGDGFAVSPRPARVDARGQRWGCVQARRGTQSLEVCERIFTEDGASWTDASSWWWSAALGRARGPYWAVTVVEPQAAGS